MTADTLQAAIGAAVTSGEPVSLAAGVYPVGDLALPPDVRLCGAGSATVLCGAVTVEGTGVARGWLRDLVIDAQGAACGLTLRNVARYHVAGVRIHDCSQVGLYGDGLLTSVLERLEIVRSSCAIYLSPTDAYPPNLVTIRDSVLQANARGAVWADQAAMLTISGCELADNGTPGDLDTGAIRLTRASVAGEGVSAIIERCWIEHNHGHSAIRIDPPTYPSGHRFILRDLAMFGGTRDYGVYVTGGPISTIYSARDCTAQNARVADWYEGPQNVFGRLEDLAVSTSDLRGHGVGLLINRM